MFTTLILVDTIIIQLPNIWEYCYLYLIKQVIVAGILSAAFPKNNLQIVITIRPGKSPSLAQCRIFDAVH